MLRNNGPFGPNEAPENLGALVNNVSLSSSPSLSSNLSKIAQQPMQDGSGRFYLPDFSRYNHTNMNMSSQSGREHGYSPMGIEPPFSSHHSRTVTNPTWQNMLPPSYPPQVFHNPNMLNYDRNTDILVQNQYTNTIRNMPYNVPEMSTNSFEKATNDLNYTPYNESYKKPADIVSENDKMTKTHEKPLLDHTKRKSLENTVRLIEDILSNTAKNKEEQRNQLNISSNVSQTLTKQERVPNSTLTSGQESLPKQQENIEKVFKPTKIDNALHIPANTQESITNASLNQEQNTNLSEKSTFEGNPSNMSLLQRILMEENAKNKNTENSSKNNNVNDKNNVNLIMESSDAGNPNYNGEKNQINNSNNNSKETVIKTDKNKEESIHNDDQESSESLSFIKVETEEYDSENDNSDSETQVDVKIERVMWPECEDMGIFQLDVNRKKADEIERTNIISGEESIVAAKEAIVKGTWEPTFYECINCSILFNHPKRYLIHHKWHSFGLTNERRMEIARDRQMWRDQRKQARMVTKKIVKQMINESGEWICDVCNKQFPNKNGLKNHRTRAHPTRTYDCAVCEKQLLGYLAYKSHMAVHKANKGGPTHQCPICDKKFVYAHTLKKHRGSHMEKTLQCPSCPKMYSTPYQLSVHQKVHERAERGTTFRCSYCGKGFYEAYNLNVHERTHRNEKPFSCEICNAAYSTNSSLKRHLKVSHSTSKPFECSICHRSFVSQGTRDRHEIRAHGDPEQMQFTCGLCDKRYLYQRDLSKHVYKAHNSANRKKLSESD